MERSVLWIFLTFLLQGVSGQTSRFQARCEQSSCYPATGDLLIGRESRLQASSTCGLGRPSRYCVVSYLEKQTKCFTCDSSQPYVDGVNENSHRIENIVSSFKERRNRWWQAENGVQNVSIRLDLEAEFHFTHIIMTFKTFRPKAMLIERSYDFGKTWKVYRYFAQNCRKYFPGVRQGAVRNITDVICSDRYSAETPSTEGEVIYRVLPPFIPIADPYSEEVQDLLKLTNLRVNFTELHTLGDTLLDSRPEIKEKYYYAIYDMTVRGSCSCYGHASRCLPVNGDTTGLSLDTMVHGMCECAHNTKGLNCEMCQDFYNDLPWRPAQYDEPNVCKKCNCNNHADSCHFDAAVYEATGRISGGVCDDCKHNTMGRNCQECIPFFFQDPNRDIRDPEICQPCDCDPFGSERDGECEGRTDDLAGTVAGRCICKRFVTGNRCDTCQPNYWNLRKDNPDGCEQCSCNALGTIGDLGCDQQSGLCRCKRYVTGNNCDQCYPGFYGLGNHSYGCYPCECDIGGALSESCDQVSGQCTCRPHIIGRRCKEVERGYYYAGLDYYLYEGEHGRGSGNARVYIREPIPSGPSYWTGRGYMQVMEGDSLEFTVSNIDFPLLYDIILRYDPRMPEVWRDVEVTVVRQEPVEPGTLCAASNPQDDRKKVSLPPDARYVVVTPPACLEPGKTYTLRLDFTRYDPTKPTPDVTLLIDSIVLMPNPDSIPIYLGRGLPEYMKNDFLRNRCPMLQMSSLQQNLPDICKMHIFSISSVLHGRALECNCDPMGSLSGECETLGGQCQCKPNVVGRRCDQCAPGTFGFGPNGCSACNCHEIGARDNFCNERTGQCTCIPNVGGRTCDMCRVGYWGFPQCRPCRCNGNADTCDDLTGACINCRNNTAGQYCDRCIDGYYGDPRLGSTLPCRPCMCPGGPGSPIQHADSCSLDTRSQRVVCNCRPGYQGDNCNQCADNYFGNPLAPGGTCQPCGCNGNIDPDVPDSCDRNTGECLKCIANTEGFSCEHCVAGYYGDATQQTCRRCVCNELGTDPNGGDCDRRTGQCPCLPNVTGQQCDRCLPSFWNMVSRRGCEACNCDPEGSVSLDCNQLTGQCDCRSGRGGSKCANCEDFYWGDPTDQCFSCDCDPRGSQAMQCDRITGQCLCVAGVTGYKCDRCARGTTGDLPNCVPCGECFDNWDKIISDLRDQTRSLVGTAQNISVTGAIKAFDDEFKHMQDSIDEVRRILATANVTKEDVSDIERMLDTIRTNLTESNKALNQIDTELSNTTARSQLGNNKITNLRRRVEALKTRAQELQNNATDIQARDVEGAFNITREAERRSREAQRKVDGTAALIADSERTRRQVEELLDARQAEFDQQLDQNQRDLQDLDGKVTGLNGRLADLNNMVCGAPGEPCDARCGGGGCGRCGGGSCSDGAVTKAENALTLARNTAELLNTKETSANDQLKNIQGAKTAAEEAKMEAKMAHDVALAARNQSEQDRADMEELLNSISDFVTSSRATPDDIKRLAEEILAMQISLTPEQIQDLANKINATIQGLQNIDAILNATRDNLTLAQNLKRQADLASEDASRILQTAQDVLSALDGAKTAQEEAERAIREADQNIQDAEADLSMIETETTAAADTTRNSTVLVQQLKQRLDELGLKFTANKVSIEQAESEARMAEELADKAMREADELDRNYQDANGQLSGKYNMTSGAQARAERLRDRADKLAANTEEKLRRLRNIRDQFDTNQKALLDLSDKIDELNRNMAVYLEEIQNKSNHYRTC